MAWGKGVSGNPKGAPKKAFTQDFDQLLAKKRMHDEGTQIISDKWADIIEAIAEQAMMGNVQAAAFLRDTFIGKPKESVQHDISEEAKSGLKLAYSLEVGSGN